MTFAFKMLKQMFLHTFFIQCIFRVIAFVTVPSKSEFISGFPYIMLTTALTCEKMNQAVIITVEFMVYLETFACCSSRKCVSFLNVLLLQGNYLSSWHFCMTLGPEVKTFLTS